MDQYQKFVLDRTLCCISNDMEIKKCCFITELLNEMTEFVIKQDDNYNIKKYNILFSANNLTKVELDEKPCETIESYNKDFANQKIIVVPVDFDQQASKIKIYFANEIATPIEFKLKFLEVDHSIYDAIIQTRLNEQIKPEHKTGNDLVNIYWNLVSNEVNYTQVNLYLSSNEIRLIGKYKESETMFKSITGLAYAKYLYEIIEFNQDDKEIARTPKIEFEILKNNVVHRL